MTTTSARGTRRLLTALAALAASLLAACGDLATGPGDDAGDAGGTVPAALVGRWYSGDVSSLTFYTQSSGSWTSAYGNGLSITFHPDGKFESGFLTTATLYGCTSKAFQYQSGTVRVDEAARTFTVRVTGGKARGEDTCVARFNYERAVEPTTFTMTYTLRRSADGRPELVVSKDGGDIALRPWTQ